MILPSAANAKWSKARLSNFNKVCMKAVRSQINAKEICKCELRNFKWLVHKKDYKLFRKIYSDPKFVAGNDSEALSTVVYEVSTNCDKKTSYVAQKVKKLEAKN